MRAYTESSFLQASPDGYNVPKTLVYPISEEPSLNLINQYNPPYQLNPIDVGDGYSWISVPYLCKSLERYSIQVDGNASGTFSIQVSNDRGTQDSIGRPDGTIVNWTTIYFTNMATNTNVNSLHVSGQFTALLEEPACTYRWLRLLYTSDGAPGTITARIQQKGTGL